MPHIEPWVKEQIAELEALMEVKGLSIKGACRVAKIPASTFFRWKLGNEPKMSTITKFKKALDRYKG
jgi:predicted transcriptional regulator